MTGKVNVLLSTYNGSAFLVEQMDSLLAQSYPHITITVRDDGSTDDTFSTLSEYAAKYPNITISRGERLGATNSYLALLCDADPTAEFYAFCDQDDVWLRNKIQDAVTALQAYPSGELLIYCSRLEFVDSQLRHLGYTRLCRGVGLANAMVENIVTGCTIVLNRRARDIICETLPRVALMHDWWCYLVVSAFGRVIYDEHPKIKYRRHSGNAVGEPINFTSRLRHFLCRYFSLYKSGPRPSDQVEELYRCFGPMLRDAERQMVEELLEAKHRFWARLKYAVRMHVWKQSRLDTAMLPIRIATGRF